MVARTFCMVALVMICAASFGGGEPQAYVLKTELDVWDVVVGDLDGDSGKDILALCSDAESYPNKKVLAAFVANSDGSYSSEPSARLALESNAGTAFLAEVDGAAPQEVVVAGHSGAIVYALQDDRFRELSRCTFDSLFPGGSVEPVFWHDATADLDGDGIDEWLIPTAEGYQIRHAEEVIALVPGHVESETRDLGVRAVQHRMPIVDTFEVEGSSRKGIAFLSDRFADFSYGPGWLQHHRYRVPRGLDERWDASVRMADIDGSGFPDLVVTQTRGTINLEVKTQVYLASEAFVYPEAPTVEFFTKGAFTTPSLRDINGDEKSDLIFLGVQLGLRNVVNYLFRKKMSVTIEAHYFEDGGFSKKATHEARITMEAPEGRERVSYTMGDFNGDGEMDAAAGISSEELAIYTGSVKDFISSRPWKTIDIPTFGSAISDDLDDDGTDDLVLFHPSGEHQRRIDVIHF